MTAPGYLLVGMTVSDPTAIDPEAGARYGELAGKALASVGTSIEMVAAGAGPTLDVKAGTFEGQNLVLERYDSLDGLHAFWNSPEYEEAKSIRRGFEGMQFHFLAAVEGTVAAPEASAAYTVSFTADGEPESAGVELIAAGDLDVLEGSVSFDGKVTVRGHDSLDAANAHAEAIAAATAFCAVLPPAPENPLG